MITIITNFESIYDFTGLDQSSNILMSAEIRKKNCVSLVDFFILF